MRFVDKRDDDRPTATQLPDIAEHVTYEAKMFFYAVDRLRPGGSFRDDPERFAAVESFLIHQRNLTDFFAGPYRKDDAAAIDFCTAWDREGEVEVSLEWLKAQRESIHKWVAHVTATRTDEALRKQVEEERRHAPRHIEVG